jgi:hypothetical protein
MSGLAASPSAAPVRARQHDARTVTCAECGVTVRSAQPIVDLCRRLVSESYADFRRPLYVYRGDALAVVIPSIEAAGRSRVMIG